jgi:hypothetical protein
MIDHAQVVEYFKGTTPAEAAAIVVEAFTYDEAITAAEFTIARATKKRDERDG